MSVIRPRPPEEPLEHSVARLRVGQEPSGLAAVRDAVVAHPDDLDLPRTLLAEYDQARPASRLFAILAAARQIREGVDRVVCVTGGATGAATRLVANWCCHPFHDQLPRGERGGRPRLAWASAEAGTDELQGLLDLVAPAGRPRSDDLLDRWAVLAIDSPADDPRLLATVRILVASLRQDHETAGPCVAITRPGGLLEAVVHRGGGLVLPEPAVAASAAVFTAAGLVPAAAAGIDVVRLLRGAAAMFRRFAEAPVADNPVLQDVAAAAEGPGRRFTGGGVRIDPLTAWHRHLLDAGPATHVVAAEQRRDRLLVPPLTDWPDGLDPLVGTPLDELSGAVAAADANVTIRLPRIDEHAVGQLLMLLLLSAAVERRLAAGSAV